MTGRARDGSCPQDGPGFAAPAAAPPDWLADLAVKARSARFGPLTVPPERGGKPSAVLILFGDGPDLLFIQRSDQLRSHPGQPAFPGGSIDPADDGPVGAALREATEETGLDPMGVQVLGTMPELYISRTGFRVVPVLAWWREPSAVRPVDMAEVTAVERIGVHDLADPASRLMIRGPGGYASPAFRVSGLLIWGFTALLVDRLLTLGGWARPWDTSVTEDLPRTAR